MSKPPIARDIERWSPKHWDEIVGNSELVDTLRDFAQFGPCNLLVTGPKRTGKTRTIKHGIKTLLCGHRSGNLEPCGDCEACKQVESPLGSLTGIFAAVAGRTIGWC